MRKENIANQAYYIILTTIFRTGEEHILVGKILGKVLCVT